MSKKKNNKSTFIIVMVFVIGLVAVGAYLGINQFAVTDPLNADESGLYVPKFGFFECKESDLRWESPSGEGVTESFSARTIKCQDTGDTLLQGCDVNFYIPTEDEANKAYSYLCYFVLDENSPIPSAGTDCQYEFYANNFLGKETPGTVEPQRLEKGQYIYAEYIEQNIFNRVIGSGNNVNKGEFKIFFNPFFIHRYDDTISSTGSALTNNPDTRDCDISDNFGSVNSIIESINNPSYPNTLNNDDIHDRLDDYSNDYLRVPGRVVPYIKELVEKNEEFLTIVDGNKYCIDRKLYPIIEIQTTTGTYRIADVARTNSIGNVECCNDGDALAVSGPGYFCDVNQEIQKKTEVVQDCRFTSECSLSQGVPGVKLIYYETCQEGKCVLESYDVECTSDFDCEDGDVCKYDSRNPEDSFCEDIKIVEKCGNGVCEVSFGENQNTCEADCGQGDDDETQGWIFAVLIIGAFLVLIFALYQRQKGNQNFVRQIGNGGF